MPPGVVTVRIRLPDGFAVPVGGAATTVNVSPPTAAAHGQLYEVGPCKVPAVLARVAPTVVPTGICWLFWSVIRKLNAAPVPTWSVPPGAGLKNAWLPDITITWVA